MKGGFTLIEIMVSVGILVVVSTLILASYPKLGDNADLTQAARTVVSSIREAQFYGISVKEFGPGEFPAYGVYFGPLPAVSYRIFADLPPGGGDNQWSGSSETVEIQSILKRGYIDNGGLCGKKNGESIDCGLSGLNIVFKRPYPDIFLYGENGGLQGPYDYVEIIIKSARGDTKKVVVWKSGQVYAQ